MKSDNSLKKVNYKGLFLIGISLIVIGTSLLSNDNVKPISIVFISVGGLFVIFSINAKNKK
jgi:hypothetical protein